MYIALADLNKLFSSNVSTYSWGNSTKNFQTQLEMFIYSNLKANYILILKSEKFINYIKYISQCL